MNDARRPDRPLDGLGRVVRAFVRRLRVLKLRALLRSRLSFGDDVFIGRRATLSPPDFIRLGDHVAIGSDFHLETNLVVGSEVLISSRVAIISNDHKFDGTNVFWGGRIPSTVVELDGDNLIGFGTIIIGPARIGRGCVVGAGAVVVGDLPPYTICAGVPARPLREREH